MNDPFECSLQFDYIASSRLFYSSKKFHDTFAEKFKKKLTREEIKEIVTSETPDKTYHEVCKRKNIIIEISTEKQEQLIQQRWMQIIEETNHDIKICSFSEINDSLLLWSHYADEHKGICVEYDLMRESPEVNAFLQPLIYSDKIHKIETFEELTSLQKIGYTLIKAKDWEYEKEWRITVLKDNNILPDKLAVSKPKAVYLGTRFDQNDENLIREFLDLLNERSIPYFKMTKHNTEYKLIGSTLDQH